MKWRLQFIEKASTAKASGSGFLASFAATLSTATEKVTLISQMDSLNQPRTDEVRGNIGITGFELMTPDL